MKTVEISLVDFYIFRSFDHDSQHLSLSDRNNGTCYRQCQGRSVLLSSTSSSAMPLSSSLGWRSGTEGKGGLSHCLWVLSVTENLAPCLARQLCPPVALTLHPDSHTHCKVSTSTYAQINMLAVL